MVMSAFCVRVCQTLILFDTDKEERYVTGRAVEGNFVSGKVGHPARSRDAFK